MKRPEHKIGFEFHPTYGYVHSINVDDCRESEVYDIHAEACTDYCVTVNRLFRVCWAKCVAPTGHTDVVRLRDLHCLTRVMELMYEHRF